MIDGGLRKIFRQRLPRFHWLTVETGATEQGIPDSNFCINSLEGWLEYKLTATFAVRMRPEQIGWIERRTRAGGRVWIAVRYHHLGGPRKGAKADSLFIYRGSAVRALALGGLRETPLAELPGGPSRWDFSVIEAILTENPLKTA